MRIILLIVLCIVLSSCITKQGDRNWFELNCAIGQYYMENFISDTDNINDMKSPNENWVTSDSWSSELEANNIVYQNEFTLPKPPSKTYSDGYGDCVNLSILSTWKYGYNNVKMWVILGNRDNNLHQIVIYSDNRVVSSRSSWIAKSRQEFIDKYSDKYDFFNFYSANFREELSENKVEELMQ